MKTYIKSILLLFIISSNSVFVGFGQVVDDQKSLQKRYSSYDEEFEYVIKNFDKKSFGNKITLNEHKTSSISADNFIASYDLKKHKFNKNKEGKYDLHILIPPLRPNKFYSIGIKTVINGAQLLNLIEIVVENKGEDQDKLLKTYLDKERELASEGVQYKEIIRKEFPNTEDNDLYKKVINPNQRKYLDNTLKVSKTTGTLKSFSNYLAGMKNSQGNHTGTYNLNSILINKWGIPNEGVLQKGFSDTSNFKKAFVKLNEKYPKNLKLLGDKFIEDVGGNVTYQSAIYKLIKFFDSKDSICHFLQGYYNIEDYPDKKAKVNQFETRYENLVKNLNCLSKCDLLGEVLELPDGSQAAISNMVDSLRDNKEELGKVLNKLRSDELLSSYNWHNTSTDKFNVQTSIDNIIFPDYGVIYTYIDDHIARPYIGINVGFPINKNVDYRTLHKQMEEYDYGFIRKSLTFFRYHIRMNIGATIGSIKKSNERDDLYNSTNLLLGCSYVIHSSVRLSVGGIFYNEYKDPLSDNETFSVNWYVSFSLNLDLKKVANGISKMFF